MPISRCCQAPGAQSTSLNQRDQTDANRSMLLIAWPHTATLLPDLGLCTKIPGHSDDNRSMRSNTWHVIKHAAVRGGTLEKDPRRHGRNVGKDTRRHRRKLWHDGRTEGRQGLQVRRSKARRGLGVGTAGRNWVHLLLSPSPPPLGDLTSWAQVAMTTILAVTTTSLPKPSAWLAHACAMKH